MDKKTYIANLIKHFLPNATGVIQIDHFSYLESGVFWLFRVAANDFVLHVCLREGVINEKSPLLPQAISDLETSTYWNAVGCFIPSTEELVLFNDKRMKDPLFLDKLYLSVNGHFYCLYLLKKRQGAKQRANAI